MSLAPLLEAPVTIPLHAFAAMVAFELGIVRCTQGDAAAPDHRLGLGAVVFGQ